MRIAWLAVPLVVLVALVGFILLGNPFERLTRNAPPV